MKSPFILEPHEYVRDINPFRQYMEQVAHYLSIKNNISYDECLKWVKENIRVINTNNEIVIKKPNDLTINNPIVTYIGKKDNGDRELKQTRLIHYLIDSINNKDLIAPTLTTYINPKIKQSHLVDFIDGKVLERSIAKKAKFTAKMNKGEAQLNLDRAIENKNEEEILKFRKEVNRYSREEQIQDNKQANAKTMNNSLSGAAVVASTPLYNPTMHSTLTSTCRSASGYANANNEKLLYGNRHYHRPDIVLNNIVSIITNVDYDAIRNVIEKYNLAIPTAKETMDIILRSSKQYWSDTYMELKIFEFIESLNELQRAAFCYVSDIFTLAQFNRDFVKNMITSFSTKMPLDESINDSEIMDSVTEEVLLLAVQICSDEMRGHQINSVKGTNIGKIVANTILNIKDQLNNYSDYISAFLRTKNVPASLSYFPSSIRHCALMSDTDSTIFTTEYWNNWMFGKLKFDDDANRVFSTMVFFAVSTLKHILALMSANFGIGADRIHQIAMKNEFKFDVFVPTLKTKHYYTIITYQEGNVFNNPEQEIKGVHLKSSNAPPIIIDEAKQIMKDICLTVKSGKLISIENILKRVADKEREIIRSIQAGELTYYRGGQIKTADTYKDTEEDSPYRHYVFWNETFGHKYGMTPPPPYSFVKISTDLTNKTKMNEWLEKMEDKELSGRIRNWLTKTKRDTIVSFLIPMELFTVKKVPKELIERVDIRSLVADVCHCFYFVLETLGIFRLNKNKTRLISDEF